MVDQRQKEISIMSRLIVVSNRVAPIQEGEATAGGLAAGVLDALRQKGGLWFGWSGDVIETSLPSPSEPLGRSRCSPSICRGKTTTSSTAASPTARYGRCCIIRSALAVSSGRSSRDIAGSMICSPQALAPLVRSDDLIWVHDYQLLCLAETAAAAGLTNRIGLFLHTPFPAPGVFMTIPAHAELFRAMCRVRSVGVPDRNRSRGVHRLCGAPCRRLGQRDGGAIRSTTGWCEPASIRSACMSMKCAPRRKRRATGARPPGCGPTCWTG